MTRQRLTDGRWTTEQLAELPIERGVRLRGTHTTPLDTFVDAAFALAVTLLVISVDDVPDSYLSLALVALVLICVYPLRLIFGAFFANASGGALPSGLSLTVAQLAHMFLVFGIGFSAMSGVLVALYLRADACRERLLLDERERYFARSEAVTWGILTVTGIGSTFMALVLPPRLGPAAGFVYWSPIVSMPIQAHFAGRGRRRFEHKSEEKDAVQ